MMNPRDRMLNAIRRKKVDRIPKHAYWTPEVMKKAEKIIGTGDLDSFFGLEQRIVDFSPFTFNKDFDRYFNQLDKDNRIKKRNWDDWDEKKYGKKTIDEWGVYRDLGSFYHFHKMTHTMSDLKSVQELKDWPWPQLCSQQYFDRIKEKSDGLKKNNIATIAYYGCIFEQAWYMRGMDNLMTDFYFNQRFADYLLNKIAEINTEAALKLNSLGIDILYTGDDVATQLDLMMSIDMWRKWIKPPTESTIKAVKDINKEALIWYHSDGNNFKILGELAEIGCDVLHPIQPECMDPIRVHKEFGDVVSIWGTIGTQKLMPFGKPEEIQDEVERIILGCDAFNGGLVIAPTHFVEPDVPWENIMAFFEKVEEISDKYGNKI